MLQAMKLSLFVLYVFRSSFLSWPGLFFCFFFSSLREVFLESVCSFEVWLSFLSFFSLCSVILSLLVLFMCLSDCFMVCIAHFPYCVLRVSFILLLFVKCFRLSCCLVLLMFLRA